MVAGFFTVISAVHNVGRYLDDYFNSLVAQTIGIENIEIVLVDDGSTDDSGARCEAFAAQYPESVRVLHKVNGGQSSARNAGLPHATGQWVCFADPDDSFSPTFFAEAYNFMTSEAGKSAELFAAHHLVHNETTGFIKDLHSLRYRFKAGNSVVNLDTKPNYVQPHVNSAFFNRQRLLESGVLFDERIHIRFEDCNFAARYMLHVPEPLLGIIASAKYYYRVRSDGSSAVQTNNLDPRTYTDVPTYGHLGILTEALTVKGSVPLWAQNIVLYDLFWVLRSSQRPPLRSLVLDEEVLDTFFDSLKIVLGYISETAISAFDLITVPNWMREALILMSRGGQGHGAVYVGWPDPKRKLIPIRYRYIGNAPAESLSVRGQDVEARYVKTIQLELLGRVILRERIVWVSSRGIVRLTLNDELQALVSREPVRTNFKLRAEDIARYGAWAQAAGAPRRFQHIDMRISQFYIQELKRKLRAVRTSLSASNLSDIFLAMLLRTVPVRRLFAHSWVLMDRDTDANDSAEVLYRWIRENRPETKIWFVLRRSSSDWSRLKRDGFKLVDYGSLRWKLLILLADHVVSTHADRYVTNPLDVARYGRPQSSFTFLQHGIIKGDISLWLNRKKIDLFITSTPDEYEYVAGESVFKFGPKEVRMTGLPRHDDLLIQDRLVPAADKNYILVMPTWRDYLTGEVVGLTNERTRNEEFASSTYARALQDMLSSTALQRVAERNGLRIAFMPHPNIQPYLGDFVLPAHVEVLGYEDVDVRAMIARAALMVTDYSSIAFNMAYLYRPVVYFQFDQDEFYSGHIERPGYFGYETHGFGPVAVTIEELEAAVTTIVEDGLPAEYLDRMKRTFPVRDGRNSERVYEAVKEISRPLSFAKASRAAELDDWAAVTESPALVSSV